MTTFPLNECWDCGGSGTSEDGLDCIPCAGDGLVCSGCELPDIDCHCADEVGEAHTS